ncbi:hypothetical protein ACNAN0_09385 [Agrilactobacillus fermenti]|uniref:hypothetical protein n=1 Tax=Agrilactobacillus fermenti TaxID=2586909 RepID=UPI001E596417|nr:hypothetical protein [Agrilactobacillus fermenti]MCD2255373.1 hypothetical protein [Agrilactobacillus fermenti]
MLNLQSKFGQRLLAIGNWLTALVSINLVWFAVTLPFWILLVFWLALPSGPVALVTLMLVLLSAMNFLMPASQGVFASVIHWQAMDHNTYFKETWQSFLRSLKQWRFNLIAALVGTLWVQFFKIAKDQVFLSAALIAGAILLLMVWLDLVLAAQYDVAPLHLWLKQPLRFFLVTVIMILLLGVNIELRVIFLLLLCSMSLSAFCANKLIKVD